MKRRPATGRKIGDAAIKATSVLASALAIFFLGWILLVVTMRGMAAFDWAFFTELPTPPGLGGGGLANAILGTVLITGLATLLGVPVGIAAGVYLAEVGRGTRFGRAVRFTTNVMMGVPSIIVGLFVYTMLVMPVGHFSGWAGAVSLAIIMLPVVARTTEDMLNLVPNEIRESALALGAQRWQVTLGVVFRAAKTGMTTGVLLAIARVSGETAPLLFTALNSVYWPSSLSEPTANLTVTIFNYAMSPYPDWQATAWGASLLIMGAVLAITILSRALLKEKKK
ncbi:MAG: phosphate ABC transporter permease PstA [Proteobacteria bacterium]|nr:phosphate ABC transporter permease PstA [Pseudomonadota bacterium]